MDQPTAEEVLRRLVPLVGEWVLEATPPGGPPWPGGGRVTFEWHASGAHLVAGPSSFPRRPTTSPSSAATGAEGTSVPLYTDERGVCRVDDMSIRDGEWKPGGTALRSTALHRHVQRRRQHDFWEIAEEFVN